MAKKYTFNEITDGTVQRVSLVKRGANRVPFRLIKSEDGHMSGMIDLANMFTVFKQEEKPAQPFVASVLVSKSADLEAAKALIVKTGLSVENMTETEDGFVFAQKDAVGNSALVKSDEHIAVQVSGLSKKGLVSYDGETESFKDLFSKAGVFPTINTATCVLSDVMYNIAYGSKSPSDAATAAGTAIEEFKQFVVGLINAIPASAFKFEDKKLKSEVETELKAKSEEAAKEAPSAEAKTEEPAKDEAAVAEEPKAEEVEAEVTAEAVAEAEPAAGEEAEAAEGVVVEKGDKAKDKPEDEEEMKKSPKKKDEEAAVAPVSPSAEEIASLIQKSMTEVLQKEMGVVGDRISKLENAIGEVATKADNAEKLAKTADKALGSSVLAQPAGDRSREIVKKSENMFEHFDTAYSRPE